MMHNNMNNLKFKLMRSDKTVVVTIEREWPYGVVPPKIVMYNSVAYLFDIVQSINTPEVTGCYGYTEATCLNVGACI